MPKKYRNTVTVEFESDTSWEDQLDHNCVIACVGQFVSSADGRIVEAEVEEVIEYPDWPFMSRDDLVIQDKVWIDQHGRRHDIATMSLDYVANVIKHIKEDPYNYFEGLLMYHSPLMKALTRRLSNAVAGSGSPVYTRKDHSVPAY